MRLLGQFETLYLFIFFTKSFGMHQKALKAPKSTKSTKTQPSKNKNANKGTKI